MKKKNYCCLLLFFVSSLLSFDVLCMFFVVLCCFFFVLCCQQCLERRHWFSFCSFESLSLDFAQILFPRGNSLFSNWKGQKIWRSGRATMSRQIQCEESVLSKTFDSKTPRLLTFRENGKQTIIYHRFWMLKIANMYFVLKKNPMQTET